MKENLRRSVMHQKNCFQVLGKKTRLYVKTEHTEKDGVQGISIEVYLQTDSKKESLEDRFIKHSEIRKSGGLKAIREDLFSIYGWTERVA
jgi:hypothetical protein